MKRRKQAHWKRILGAMALNLGRVYRDIFGSSAGATTIDLLGASLKQRSRPRRRRARNR